MKSIINNQVEYNSASKSLKMSENTIMLSAPTARLLDLFIAHNQQLLNREFIINEVWEKYGLAPSGHSLNKSVSMLRRAFAELGADNPVDTLPRQGFIFHACVSALPEPVEENALPSATPVPDAVHLAPRTAEHKRLRILLLTLFAIGIFFVLMPVFRKASSVVYIKEIGSCEIYTADDNNAEKTRAFLASAFWQDLMKVCNDGKKVVVYYDDNNLSPHSELKENFFSLCAVDERGIAHECENTLY